MNKPYLKVKKLTESAIIPSKRGEDAGFDIYAATREDFILLKPGELYKFPTGIAIEVPQDWIFYIAERSSCGARGIAKRAGIIDSGYRGEIIIIINNTSNKPIIFTKHGSEKINRYLKEQKMDNNDVAVYPLNKAIAQGILLYCPHIEIEEVKELKKSARGDGAFGSTKK